MHLCLQLDVSASSVVATKKARQGALHGTKVHINLFIFFHFLNYVICLNYFLVVNYFIFSIFLFTFEELGLFVEQLVSQASYWRY